MYLSRRATLNLRLLISSDVSIAPWNIVGSKRPSLYLSNGMSGSIEPYLSTVFE
ncbi:hypothetical protein D3C76_1867080 [compost metagenome]